MATAIIWDFHDYVARAGRGGNSSCPAANTLSYWHYGSASVIVAVPEHSSTPTKRRLRDHPCGDPRAHRQLTTHTHAHPLHNLCVDRHGDAARLGYFMYWQFLAMVGWPTALVRCHRNQHRVLPGSFLRPTSCRPAVYTWSVQDGSRAGQLRCVYGLANAATLARAV